MDERLLTEKLIGFDSSNAQGVRLCAGFVRGWLEARDVTVHELTVRDLPVLVADAGPEDAPLTVLLHGHMDVVPGLDEQFAARVEGERRDATPLGSRRGAARSGDRLRVAGRFDAS